MPDREVVAAVRARLIGRIGQARYELWFGLQTRLIPQGDTLLVVAPNRICQDWLRRNFREALSHSYGETIGCAALVEFRVAEVENAKTESAEAKSITVEGNEPTLPLATAAPGHAAVRDQHARREVLVGSGDAAAGRPTGVVPFSAIPFRAPSSGGPSSAAGGIAPHASRREPVESSSSVSGPRVPAGGNSASSPAAHSASRRFARLEQMVPGDSNQLALHAARMILDQPGKINPLLVQGPTAIGKTHLLEGICSEVRRLRRGQAIYLSAEQFTNAFVEAIRGGGTPNFRRKYRGVDWLFIDDLQFFCGKKATITELLHTIDTFLREGRQLVLAADRPPQELPGLGEELVTRLQSGLTCAMQPPDLAMRQGIVQRLASDWDCPLPDDVVDFIAEQLTAHARELAGAVKLLSVTCQARGCRPTVELAQETLAEMIRASAPAIGLADIERAVCGVFGLEPKTLQTSDGSRAASHPRMLAMWLARKYTRAALAEIGRYFGRRSHSTVLSAQKKVKEWMDQGQNVQVSQQVCPAAEAVRRIEAQLRAS